MDDVPQHGRGLREPGRDAGASCRSGRAPRATLNIHGYHQNAEKFGALVVYGSDALGHPESDRATTRRSAHACIPICPYTAAEVVWAAREEMARTVEDVLARRTRALFLNARAAIAMAPRVAALLAREQRRDAAWQASEVERFAAVAAGYVAG